MQLKDDIETDQFDFGIYKVVRYMQLKGNIADTFISALKNIYRVPIISSNIVVLRTQG